MSALKTKKKGTSTGKSVTSWAARRTGRPKAPELTPVLQLSAESWEIAKAQSTILGPTNPLISDVIRAISNASSIIKSDDAEAIKSFSHQSASFLVKVSPTIASALFFAARELHPADLLSSRPLTRSKLVSLLEPEELLAIISTTYLVRVIRRNLADPFWNLHFRRLLTHITLGGLLGRHISMIGHGYGTIIGAINYVSMLIHAATMPQPFIDYQTHLKENSILFDPAKEVALFGCCHNQVAIHLAATMGFDAWVKTAFTPQNEIGAKLITTFNAEITPREAASWRATLRLLTELHQSGEMEESISKKLMSPNSITSVLRTAQTIRQNAESLSPWFTKNGTDLPLDIQHELGISSEQHNDDTLAR